MPKKNKYWSITTALEEATKIGIELSRPTIIKWCRTMKIGFQLGGEGGKWYISPKKFMEYISNAKKQTDQEEIPGRADGKQDPNTQGTQTEI